MRKTHFAAFGGMGGGEGMIVEGEDKIRASDKIRTRNARQFRQPQHEGCFEAFDRRFVVQALGIALCDPRALRFTQAVLVGGICRERRLVRRGKFGIQLGKLIIAAD